MYEKKDVRQIMKLIRIIFSLGAVLMLTLAVTNCFANEAQERSYLQQILNQLNAVQSLILAAQKEQPKNIRITFHYTKFRDSQGQRHNGLLEDVQAIKAGIVQKLSQPSIEPRVVKPLNGDYLDSYTENNQP